MNVNLGCGEKMIEVPNWLNVDCRKLLPPKNVVFKRMNMMNIRDYLKDNSVKMFKLWDSLEHIPKKDAEKLLADCYAILAVGGEIEIKTPAIHLLLQWAKTHDETNTSFRFFGGQDYSENVHMYCWPQQDLLNYLQKLGFRIVSVNVHDDTDMLVKAVK